MSNETIGQQWLAAEDVYVALTYAPLEVQSILNSVKSPKAGAVVLFAGGHTTHPPRTLD